MTTLDHHDTHVPHTNSVVIVIAVIAALGGLLFGYDTGVIGVALLGLGKQFALDDLTKQLVTGGIIFGALFGCLGTGPLSDKFGRRTYLLWTIPGSIVALIIMGYLFMGGGPQTDFSRTMVVICLAAYLMLNCGGFGVCIWLINAEVYPLFVRGKGASLGSFSHWFFDLIVTLTTLSLVTALGATYTFWLYALISIGAVVFIIFLVPETKGKSLEEIERELRENRFYPFQQK